MQVSFDTFTDTDGTLLESHTGDCQATWTKHGSFSTGSLAIDNANRLRPNATVNISAYYPSGTPQGADGTIIFDIFVQAVNNGYMGVAQRINTGAKTYYFARANLQTQAWEVGKNVSGTQTVLQSSAHTFTASESDTGNIFTVSGSSLTLVVGGTQIINTSDSAIAAAGKSGVIGLASANADDTHNARLDNFNAQDTFSYGLAESFGTRIRPVAIGAAEPLSAVYLSQPTPPGNDFQLGISNPGRLARGRTDDGLVTILASQPTSVPPGNDFRLGVSNPAVLDKAKSVDEYNVPMLAITSVIPGFDFSIGVSRPQSLVKAKSLDDYDVALLGITSTIPGFEFSVGGSRPLALARAKSIDDFNVPLLGVTAILPGLDFASGVSRPQTLRGSKSVDEYDVTLFGITATIPGLDFVSGVSRPQSLAKAKAVDEYNDALLGITAVIPGLDFRLGTNNPRTLHGSKTFDDYDVALLVPAVPAFPSEREYVRRPSVIGAETLTMASVLRVHAVPRPTAIPDGVYVRRVLLPLADGFILLLYIQQGGKVTGASSILQTVSGASATLQTVAAASSGLQTVSGASALV